MIRVSITASVVFALPVWAVIAGNGIAHCDEFDGIRQRIRSYVANEGVPSVSVAAIRESKVLWLQSFGWADVERQMPATPKTPYMLASASKPITATAVVAASEKGCIDLDASINGYLGTSVFRSRLGDASKITVRDVLMHRSGLPNHNEAFFLHERYRPPGIDGLIRMYGWTMIPYGEFHYSNLAYASLSQVIANTTETSFPSFVQSEVFDPLGMRESWVVDGRTPRRSPAVRYGEKGRLRDFSTSMAPAAEIYSSARDMAQFAIFHLMQRSSRSRKVVSAKGIDQMQESSAPIRFYHYSYGLGWSIGHDRRGRRHVFHGGGFAGCDCMITLLPEHRVAVVVLSNKNRRWPGMAVSQDIVERTLAVLVDDDLEMVRINYDRATMPTSDRDFDRFVGVWAGNVVVGNAEEVIRLQIDAKGVATANIGDASTAEIENPEVIANAFFGTSSQLLQAAASRLPTKERLIWDLRRDDDLLSGVLYVNCPSEGSGYTLPYWVTLRRRVGSE